MALGLLLNAGKGLVTTPIGRTIAREALGTAIVGAPIAVGGAMLGAQDRKRELYDQQGPDGKYDFSITDRIFGGLTGTNEAGMQSYEKGRLNRTAASANAELGLDGSKGGIQVREDDTKTSLEGRINRRRKTENRKEELGGVLEQAEAIYNLPQNREERRLSQQRYNDTILREAQIRADGINARQESNMLQLQLAEMADRRDHRKDKANARMQMVAALTNSLGGLGDAFLSI